MRSLIDTSIVVRTSQPTSDAFRLAVDAVKRLRPNGFRGCLVPQVFYEYWAVVTRPINVNGLGFTAEQAALELAQLTSMFDFVRDERAIFEHWQRLVTSYKVLGKNSHDARLVAAMLRHGITHILTLNPKDFARFTSIKIMTPSDLVTNS
ncbi:PIN domain protein [Rosistilla oblonga]|uniref:type II toxin-antitoxin system VapC family toxin n=1 Tax=Rosistilla oblonga TaxID=2527990 RepID=UPI00118A0D07|nr:type II toxin-antitoxin system VapC family toxin [Rosistilla oblonga]QDV13887.1 PIN domain protein [Rosistilla oblonga]